MVSLPTTASKVCTSVFFLTKNGCADTGQRYQKVGNILSQWYVCNDEAEGNPGCNFTMLKYNEITQGEEWQNPNLAESLSPYRIHGNPRVYKPLKIQTDTPAVTSEQLETPESHGIF